MFLQAATVPWVDAPLSRSQVTVTGKVPVAKSVGGLGRSRVNQENMADVVVDGRRKHSVGGTEK